MTMVTIAFPDLETEGRAVAFLFCRYPGRFLSSGEYQVTQEALEALAGENIPFTILNEAAAEPPEEALRDAANAQPTDERGVPTERMPDETSS